MSRLVISASEPLARAKQFSDLEDRAMDTQSTVEAEYEGHVLTVKYETELDDVSFLWDGEIVTRGKALERLRTE